MNKYHNTKTTIDNIKFDSKSEANRYLELKMLLKAKKIADLKLQPKFQLQEKFTDNKGVKHQAITYVADFMYNENGELVVEDVKASKDFQTQVYRIKKKMFLFKYDAFDFREVY